jgi:SET domain-containing protein
MQRCSGDCVNRRRGLELIVKVSRLAQAPLQLICAMAPLSYLSLKTEVRESKIHGRGLFATADIAQDEIVAVKGGHIVDRKTLREKITPLLGPVEIQIDDDLFIAPVTKEERELSMLYLNHSCDPNLGLRGEITFVARRDIRAGEELTHDWAMTDDDDYSDQCNCGASDCRKVLTGKDWQRRDLQKRYAGYFSAYLARKTTALERANVLVSTNSSH